MTRLCLEVNPMVINPKTISYKDLKSCRYLLRFSYIGTNYSGLQRQTNRERDVITGTDGSVQYQIETAIQTQLRPIYGARLATSSRTDSGVHAIVNTAHVDLTHPYINTRYNPLFITESVNSYLIRNRQEIRLLSTQLVGNGFNARNAAKWRTYLYRLAVIEDIDVNHKCLDSLLPISELNKCHVIKGDLNVEEMRRVVELFKGCHDFASFTPKPVPIGDKQMTKDSVKTILELNFNEKNCLHLITQNTNALNPSISLWSFEIKCKSFLYNQIRRMIGSIIDVGLNRFDYKHIQWLLENPSHKNWNVGQTVAPSKGLWLTDIHYEESDLKLYDEFGEEVNAMPNSYPNYDQISHFID